MKVLAAMSISLGIDYYNIKVKARCVSPCTGSPAAIAESRQRMEGLVDRYLPDKSWHSVSPGTDRESYPTGRWAVLELVASTGQ